MKDSLLGSSRHKPNQEYSNLKHPTAHLGGPTHVKASCLTGPIQWHTYQPAPGPGGGAPTTAGGAIGDGVHDARGEGAAELGIA
jgi:hypothetical protein